MLGLFLTTTLRRLRHLDAQIVNSLLWHVFIR